MNVSPKGLADLLSHEGIVCMPYKDSQGVWTISVGITKASGIADPLSYPKGVAQPLADMIELFRRTLPKYEADVRRAVKVPLEQHEFDALVSFHYNTGAISRASLTKALNAGDRAKAAALFMQWTKNPELVERREKEQALFRDGTYSGDGMATVYPATAAGRVLWGKGERVSVAALLGAATKPEPTPAPPEKPPEPVSPPAAPVAPPASPSFWQLFVAAFKRRSAAHG